MPPAFGPGAVVGNQRGSLGDIDICRPVFLTAHARPHVPRLEFFKNVVHGGAIRRRDRGLKRFDKEALLSPVYPFR